MRYSQDLGIPPDYLYNQQIPCNWCILDAWYLGHVSSWRSQLLRWESSVLPNTMHYKIKWSHPPKQQFRGTDFIQKWMLFNFDLVGSLNDWKIQFISKWITLIGLLSNKPTHTTTYKHYNTYLLAIIYALNLESEGLIMVQCSSWN